MLWYAVPHHGRSGEFAAAAEVASEYHILYSGLTGTGKTAGQTCVILCGIQALRPSGQSQ